MVRRVVLGFTAVAMSVFLMVVSGGPTWVGNVAQGQSALPAPASVSAVNGNNPGEVVVSWNAVADAAYYRIGWMADEDYQAARLETHQEWEKEFRYSNVVNRGQNSRTVTRLTPGIKYYFIVGSHSSFYGGPQWSSWADLTLPAATPTTGGQTGVGGAPLPTSQFQSSALKYQAIDAGKNHTCGIKLDNTIECWGDNTHGQTDAPEGQFLSVSAGGVASCGINFDDNLECWGHARMQTPPAGDYTQVSVGDEHACAITVAAKVDDRDVNRVVCWGLPSNDGRTANLDSGRGRPWVYIGAGSDYNCAAAGNTHIRDIKCWGSNSVDYWFDDWDHVRSIGAGSQHRCVLSVNSAVRCSGNDVHGQTTSQPSAQDEGSPDDFYTYGAISAGGRHTCGLRTTGNIRCWGDNLRGQAMPPGGNDELRANEIGVGDFTAVSAGDAHTCGLRRDGTLVCWGLNDHDQAAPN